MHPLDIGHQCDSLPGPQVLNSELEVLPQGTAGHAIEIAHHDEKSDFATGRSPFEGGQYRIPIVFGLEFASRLESDDSRRHAVQLFDHRSVASPARSGSTRRGVGVAPKTPEFDKYPP